MNFILGIMFSIVMVSILALIPWVGVYVLDLRYVFGVIIPYAAITIFILGFVFKVLGLTICLPNAGMTCVSVPSTVPSV